MAATKLVVLTSPFLDEIATKFQRLGLYVNFGVQQSDGLDSGHRSAHLDSEERGQQGGGLPGGLEGIRQHDSNDLPVVMDRRPELLDRRRGTATAGREFHVLELGLHLHVLVFAFGTAGAGKTQQILIVEVRGDLASNYEQLATVNAMLAKKSGDPQYVREACHWYERGLETFRDLQQRGALGQDDVEDMKSVAGEVSKCETALKASDPAP